MAATTKAQVVDDGVRGYLGEEPPAPAVLAALQSPLISMLTAAAAASLSTHMQS